MDPAGAEEGVGGGVGISDGFGTPIAPRPLAPLSPVPPGEALPGGDSPPRRWKCLQENVRLWGGGGLWGEDNGKGTEKEK